MIRRDDKDDEVEEPFEQAADGWGVPEARPIDPRIREEVLRKLRPVELECGVRVLFACTRATTRPKCGGCRPRTWPRSRRLSSTTTSPA